MIGEQIKHYKIESLLGEGGMGAVYLARDLNLGRQVAVKVLLPELLRVPDLKARLAQEARVQGRLNHPGIVSVFDFDEAAGIIVMEYVEGKPLDDVIVAAGGPLPLEMVRQILRQVAQAIDYAHHYRDGDLPEGIVHRDLKPANILIRQTPTAMMAKVTDFGVARIVGDARRLTATGTQMGTLWYMSPEQVRAPKDVDHRSDVYALGVLLFEMLTGTIPFDGDSDFNVMSNIVQGDAPSILGHNASLPAGLEGVIQTALYKDPDERFQSCGALCAAFEDALDEATRSEASAAAAQSAPPPAQPDADTSLASILASFQAQDITVQLGAALGVLLVLGFMGWALMGRSGSASYSTTRALTGTLSPQEVVEGWVAANRRRDIDALMEYYAPTVQLYNKTRRKYEVLAAKAKTHAKFDLRNDETIANMTVNYDNSGHRALVEFDSRVYWEGYDADPFWYDARRRVRLNDFEGRWLIDCEEESMVRASSNEKAEGTEICIF